MGRRHRRRRRAASLGVYIVYVVLSPNGARGGSLMGLFFAALGTGIIVFECLLGLRKKYPASPLGRVKTWLSAHVWLGLLSFLLILMHSGFRWGHGLAAVLMWIFAVILVSGIFGVALQNYIPRRMTELVPRETIYEQIPTVIRGLRIEADERVEFVTADLGIDGRASRIRARRRREAVLRPGAEEERRRKGAGRGREAQDVAADRNGGERARGAARALSAGNPAVPDGLAGAALPAPVRHAANWWPRTSTTCAPSCRWPRTTCCATWKRSARSAASCWCSAACTCGCTPGCWCTCRFPSRSWC